MIFLRDATQLVVPHLLHVSLTVSAEVSAFNIPILKLPFQMQVLQVVKLVFNLILPSILLANNFSFT